MYTFHIPKMSCGGCASAITRAIKSVDENAQVNVDIGNKTVEVETTSSQSEVKQAISQAGYPPNA